MRQVFNSSLLLSLGLVATSLLAGCPDRTISQVVPEQGRVEYKDIPVTVNRDIDILFVIDDSPSMDDKQKNLQNNFPNFINVLKTIPGGLPNVHLGVVTSDVGSVGQKGPGPQVGSGRGSCSGEGKKGALQTGMATGMLTGSFLSDIQRPGNPLPPRDVNYTGGDLAAVFGQMARIGADGCGFEQHLEAAKRALTPNFAPNQGFVRKDAYLAIIFIADEDDCSLNDAAAFFVPENPTLGPLQSFRCTRFGVTCDVGGGDPNAMNQVGTKDMCRPNNTSSYLAKVAEYATFFKSLKTDPDQVIVAGIMGTTTPYQVELRAPPAMPNGTKQISLAHSCMYQGQVTPTNPTGVEVADPPTRIQAVLDQFPNRSTFTTICQTDLQDGLQLIAQLLKTVIGDPCIEGNLADVNPAAGPPVYDCAVSFVTDQGKPTQSEKVVAACNGALSNVPCWHLIPDATNCSPTDPKSLHLTLKIEGDAPSNAHIIANCVTTSCGDGIVDGGEVCDDGNQESGDGCAYNCRTKN